MNKKYQIIDFFEVLSEEFIESTENLTAQKRLPLVMGRIEDYEEKHNVEFVSFYATQYIIFKPKNHE